jgi:hypothetical protein
MGVTAARGELFLLGPWEMQVCKPPFSDIAEKKKYHGEYVLVLFYHALQQHRPAPIVSKEFIHFFWEVFGAAAADGVHTHRLCETYKVWIFHHRMRIARLIEKVLTFIRIQNKKKIESR